MWCEGLQEWHILETVIPEVREIPPPLPKSLPVGIYVVVNGEQAGPFCEEDIRRKLATGELSNATLGWEEGLSSWKPLFQFINDVSSTPPPIPKQRPKTAQQSRDPQRTMDATIVPFLSLIFGFLVLVLLLIFDHAPAGLLFGGVCLIVGIRTGHFARRTKDLPNRGIALAGLILNYSLAVILVFNMEAGFSDAGGKPAETKVRPTPEVQTVQTNASPHAEETLAAAFETRLNREKQTVFNSIHPIGTAKNIKVNDASVSQWKSEGGRRIPDDILEISVRFTLYWEGPIEKDGYTQIAATFNAEIHRFVSSKILSTNGVTNSDALNVLGQALQAELQYEAIKEGAREAGQQYGQ